MTSLKRDSFGNLVKGELAVLLLRLIAFLPLSLSQKLGAFMGYLSFVLNTREVQIAKQNISLCFSEMDSVSRKLLLRQYCVESGMLAVETAFAWFNRPEKVIKQIRDVQGEHFMEAAHAQNSGVIVVLPHLGNWEMLNAYILSKYSGSAMYTPARLKAVNRVMIAGRERTGLKLEEASSKGVLGLFKTLKKGGTLFILPDQEPSVESGEFAPFFGIETLTMTLISKLANKSQAPAIIAYAKRNGVGEGFSIVFKSLDSSLSSDDIHISLKTLNEAVEACVRENPTQYLWGYKRFRKKPEGEQSRYKKK